MLKKTLVSAALALLVALPASALSVTMTTREKTKIKAAFSLCLPYELSPEASRLVRLEFSDNSCRSFYIVATGQAGTASIVLRGNGRKHVVIYVTITPDAADDVPGVTADPPEAQ